MKVRIPNAVIIDDICRQVREIKDKSNSRLKQRKLSESDERFSRGYFLKDQTKSSEDPAQHLDARFILSQSEAAKKPSFWEGNG